MWILLLALVACLGSEEEYEEYVQHPVQVDCEIETCEVIEIEHETPEPIQLEIAPCWWSNR